MTNLNPFQKLSASQKQARFFKKLELQFEELHTDLMRNFQKYDEETLNKKIKIICQNTAYILKYKNDYAYNIYISQLLLVLAHGLTQHSNFSQANKILNSLLKSIPKEYSILSASVVTEKFKNFILKNHKKKDLPLAAITAAFKKILSKLNLNTDSKYQACYGLIEGLDSLVKSLLSLQYYNLAIEILDCTSRLFKTKQPFRKLTTCLHILDTELEKWCAFYLLPNDDQNLANPFDRRSLVLTNNNQIYYVEDEENHFIRTITTERNEIPFQVQNKFLEIQYPQYEKSVDEMIKANFESLNQPDRYSPKRVIIANILYAIHIICTERNLIPTSAEEKNPFNIKLISDSLYALDDLKAIPIPEKNKNAFFQKIFDIIDRQNNILLKCIFIAEYLLSNWSESNLQKYYDLLDNSTKDLIYDGSLNSKEKVLYNRLSDVLIRIGSKLNNPFLTQFYFRGFLLASHEKKIKLILTLSNQNSPETIQFIIKNYLSCCQKADLEKFLILVSNQTDGWLTSKAPGAATITLLILLLFPDLNSFTSATIYSLHKKEILKFNLNIFAPIINIIFNPGNNLGPYLSNLPAGLKQLIGIFTLDSDLAKIPLRFLEFTLKRRASLNQNQIHPPLCLNAEAKYWTEKFSQHYNYPLTRDIRDKMTEMLLQTLAAPEFKIGYPYMLDKALRLHITASVINWAQKGEYLNKTQIEHLFSQSIARVGKLRSAVTEVIGDLNSEEIIAQFKGKFLPLKGEVSRLIDGLTLVWMVYFPHLSIAAVKQQRVQFRDMILNFLLSPCLPKPKSSPSQQDSLTLVSPAGLPQYCTRQHPSLAQKNDLVSVRLSQTQRYPLMVANLDAEQKKLLNIAKSSRNRSLTEQEQKQLIFDRTTVVSRDDKGSYLVKSLPDMTISTRQMQIWFANLIKEKPSQGVKRDINQVRSHQG